MNEVEIFRYELSTLEQFHKIYRDLFPEYIDKNSFETHISDDKEEEKKGGPFS